MSMSSHEDKAESAPVDIALALVALVITPVLVWRKRDIPAAFGAGAPHDTARLPWI